MYGVSAQSSRTLMSHRPQRVHRHTMLEDLVSKQKPKMLDLNSILYGNGDANEVIAVWRMEESHPVSSSSIMWKLDRLFSENVRCYQ